MRTTFSFLIVLFLVSTFNITIGFAQDSSVYIYWTDHFAGKIQRANLDGTNVQDIVTGLGWSTDIAFDMSMNKMYWTNRDTTSKIQRANLDGTNIETLVTSDTSLKESIALDISGGKMYWTKENKIQRANLDGTNIETLVTDIISLRGIALEFSQGKMYWADYGSSKIQRANLDGTNIEDVVTGLNRPNRIALDFSGGKIYWADESAGKIQCANLDGSHIRDLVLGLDFPIGIALDTSNGKMYWTDPGADKIQRANLDGTNIEDLVTIAGAPSGIALSIPQTPAGLRFSPNVIADRTLTVDTTVSFTLPIAIGGNPPYTYSISALPAGLEFDALSVQIHGTPTTLVNAHPVTYTATDATGASASLTFTITVRDTPALTDVYMYWADLGTNKIQRANLDGTNVQDLLTGFGRPTGITLDISSGKIYWTDSDRAGQYGIHRMNLDGTNIETLVVGEPFVGEQIALDISGGKMYWALHFNKIQRANLDGTNVEDLVIGQEDPRGMALDIPAGKMYWTDLGAGKIQRANLDGSNIEVLVTGLDGPSFIALDVNSGKLYWTDWTSGKVQRANSNGTNLEDIVIGLSYPVGIALDSLNGKMYWVEAGSDKIQRANLDGTNVETLVTGVSFPVGIALSVPQVPGGLRLSPNVIADQTFTVGEAVNLTLPTAIGGTPPYLYSLTPSLPAGLSFDLIANGPGHIGGTPTAAMPTTPYTYTATDAAAQTASLTFTMTVTDTGPGPGGNLDVNGDGQVNVLDLILVAVFYGTRGDGLPADVNADGVVNVDDFAAVAAGVDAAGGLPLQAVEAALLAAAAQAGDMQAVAGAPMGLDAPQYTWSKQVAYHNVATAFADVRLLAADDVRLEKGVALLAELLQLLKEMNAIPETTALLPNYPNPFNPETWIPYHLATEAEVTVTIYNVQGSAVRQLVLGHQPAGVYESRGRAAYWNGKNTLGEPVASGLYFYTLTAGEFNATRRLLIAK